MIHTHKHTYTHTYTHTHTHTHRWRQRGAKSPVSRARRGERRRQFHSLESSRQQGADSTQLTADGRQTKHEWRSEKLCFFCVVRLSDSVDS
jgi:hypothetical protein